MTSPGLLSDRQGYSYLLGVVRVDGHPQRHYQPEVQDMVWLMLSPEIRGPQLGHDENLQLGWAVRWPLTACGLTAGRSWPPPIDVPHCETCWDALDVIWPQLVEQLAERFRQRLPQADRAALLADYRVRYGRHS